MKIHQKSKPYNCQVCRKRYTRISTLKIHSLLHQMKNKTDLNVHSLETHFNEDQRKVFSFPFDSDINNNYNQKYLNEKEDTNMVGSTAIMNNNNYIEYTIQPISNIIPQYDCIYGGYYNQSYLNPSLYNTNINANLSSYALFNQQSLNNYLCFLNKGNGL